MKRLEEQVAEQQSLTNGNPATSDPIPASSENVPTAAVDASSLHHHSVPSPRQKPANRLLRGLVLGGTAIASAAVGVLVALTLPLPTAIAPKGVEQPLSLSELWQRGFRYSITRPINILVMGIDLPLDLPPGSDASVFAGRSDTMLLVHLDPDQETVSLLSIPRDTQVMIPGEGMEKINYANVVGGPKLAAQIVSQNLNGITIDRYVRVSTEAFRELVDLLGGVDVYVPKPMKYQDDTQKLYINLKQGQQTLNGKQAEQFARFRHDEYGDIGRVQRQQQLIRALREKLTNPIMLARLPQAIQLFQKYIDTNLTPEEMLALANYGIDLKQDNFRMVMLPGRFSRPDEFVASYWIMDPAGRDQVMTEYFDINATTVLSEHHSQTDLKIAVQNASDNPLLGSQVVAYLQNQGYNNVYEVPEWPDHQDKTQIIVQRGDLHSAQTLETLLGIGQVLPTSTGDLDSDLTIRVGDDWSKRPQI